MASRKSGRTNAVSLDPGRKCRVSVGPLIGSKDSQPLPPATVVRSCRMGSDGAVTSSITSPRPVIEEENCLRHWVGGIGVPTGLLGTGSWNHCSPTTDSPFLCIRVTCTYNMVFRYPDCQPMSNNTLPAHEISDQQRPDARTSNYICYHSEVPVRTHISYQ